MTLGEVLLGICTAVPLAYSATARAYIRQILVFSQAIPVFALAPILTLRLGYGLLSKIAMAVRIIYFPVTSAFLAEVMNIPKGYLDLAETMGANKIRVLLRIRMPSALLALASGLRLAAVYAPVGPVIGEWVGASRGSGYLMLLANGKAKIDLMFAALIVLALLAVALCLIVDFLGKRLNSEQ